MLPQLQPHGEVTDNRLRVITLSTLPSIPVSDSDSRLVFKEKAEGPHHGGSNSLGTLGPQLCDGSFHGAYTKGTHQESTL